MAPQNAFSHGATSFQTGDVRYHGHQVDRNDLRALSRVRLSEAKALLRAGLPDGAYYLAGYAVECALKACIAKDTQRYEFPEKKRVEASYTHDLRELVRVAGLRNELRASLQADALFQGYWISLSYGRNRAATPGTRPRPRASSSWRSVTTIMEQ